MHADAGAIAHQRAAVDDDWKLHCTQCTGREPILLIPGTPSPVSEATVAPASLPAGATASSWRYSANTPAGKDAGATKSLTQ